MRTTRIVDVDLYEIIHANYKGFLGILEDLFFAEESEEERGVLDDVVYKPVGMTEEGLIRIEVTAIIEPF